MKPLRYSLLLLGFTAATLPAALQPKEIRTLSPAAIEAALPAEHPAAYYAYASRLFAEGKKDDSVFWYYAGQIRYRLYLKANPTLAPSGDPALFTALTAAVGQHINGWAGGDPKMMFAQIDRALAWDKATENGFTSKATFKKEHEEIRAGLVAMKANMEKNLPALLEQRRKAGMEIRAQ